MRGVSVFSLACALLLAACTHTPPASPPSVHKPDPATPAIVRPPAIPAAAAPAAPGLSYRPLQPLRQLADGAQVPAVQGLLAASERAVQVRDFDLAAVNLERAQRLAPQSATVYQRLSDVRLRQKRPAEAEQLARKALAYSSGPSQQALLWRQIALARQQMGQAQLAQDALAHAAALESAAAGSAP